MTALHTTPLTDLFGVEVTGIDLNTITDPGAFAPLRTAFEDHGALLFRNQSMTPQTHLRIAEFFGPLEDRKADKRKAGETVEISVLSNIASDGGVTGAMDLHTLNLKANLLWHCDSTFMPVPALTNVLTAHVVTPTGGATELASTRAAFHDMSPARQQVLRGLVFRHHFSHSRARISKELAELPLFHKWPEQRWPAVLRNPANGAEAVYVASHVRGVLGMDAAKAAAFVDALIEECTQPRYVYAHQWAVGDVLIWDQRAVLHRGTPWPDDAPRKLASVCASMTEGDGLAAMRARAADLMATAG